MRLRAPTGLLPVALLVAGSALAGAARAEDLPRIASASATADAWPDETFGVARLFDWNATTSFCARQKVGFTISVKLSDRSLLRAAYLGLGDPASWKFKPRVKQVFVSVLQDGKLVKKIRHMWPDRDAFREGKINLNAPGDEVVIELDKVYAGRGGSGLCLAGLRLEAGLTGAEVAVDGTDLALQAWEDDELDSALERRFTVTRNTADGSALATLVLGRRGSLEYRDDELKLKGKWKIERDDGGRRLVFTISRATLGRGKVGLPAEVKRHAVPWRLRPGTDGEPPALVPWTAYAVEEGSLVRVAPETVEAR